MTVSNSSFVMVMLVQLGAELDIPPHMIPPNPDDSDSSYTSPVSTCCDLAEKFHSQVLPSLVHPSYPYGNPTNIRHPAARPRPPYDPTSRALFEDMGYAGGGINGAMRWRDLALDQLLPLTKRRKRQLGRLYKQGEWQAELRPIIHQSNPQQQQMQQGQNIDEDEDDEDDNDENDNDEDVDEDDEGSSDDT